MTEYICFPDRIFIWMENPWQRSTLPSIGLRTISECFVVEIGKRISRGLEGSLLERREIETPHFFRGLSIASRLECLGTSSLSEYGPPDFPTSELLPHILLNMEDAV